MRLKCAFLVLLFSILVVSVQACAPGSDPAQSPTTTPATQSTTTTTLSPAEVALGEMTVRQKAAQVLLLTFSGKELNEDTSGLMTAGPPGGLLILSHNVADPVQMQTLTDALQRAASLAGSPVGLFIAVDQEGGRVQRIKQGVPELLSAREMGTDSAPASVSYLATQTAIGLLRQGINMNLAPVADVVEDDGSFLYARSYSGDPALVSEFVTAVIEAGQARGVISVVKHFPGHGSASGNTHTEEAVSGLDRADYESIHLPPFYAAVSAGVKGVMLAHIVAPPYDPENPASLSSAVIEDLLRDDLGFDGLVVADDVSMAAALDSVTDSPDQEGGTDLSEEELLVAREVQAVAAALNAGCDLLILTELETRAAAVLDGLVVAIEQGAVSRTRLNEAVLRILELKLEYGIVAVEIPSTTTSEPKEASP